MTIEALDHVNLRTANLALLKDFYSRVLRLDLRETGGEKRGYWLGVGGQVMLHLIEADRTDRVQYPQIEHFAFRANGLMPTMGWLDRIGIAYNLNPIPAVSLVQLNLRDPDDNRVHLDFPIHEFESGMAPEKLSDR